MCLCWFPGVHICCGCVGDRVGEIVIAICIDVVELQRGVVASCDGDSCSECFKILS